MLDNIIAVITDRFSDQFTNFLDMNVLIPNNLINIGDAELKQKINRISTNFAKLINEDETQLRYNLYCEILILKQSIQSHSGKFLTTLEETLISFDEEIFPTISKLLLIHYRLPVSVASAERSLRV
jgi:hypothetical protein